MDAVRGLSALNEGLTGQLDTLSVGAGSGILFIFFLKRDIGLFRRFFLRPDYAYYYVFI